MIIKPRRKADDLRRAVLEHAAVPNGLCATFEYHGESGGHLQLDTPHPVTVDQAFSPTTDPTKSLRDQVQELGRSSASSGLLGRIATGRWFFVNWDGDWDSSNKHGRELEGALADLNATLGRQRKESDAHLLPFPTREVTEMLLLPYFEDFEFTAAEAGQMTSDLSAMYDQIIEANLFDGFRQAIAAGTARADDGHGLAQLDPTFLKPLASYDWAKQPIADYLATPSRTKHWWSR